MDIKISSKTVIVKGNIKSDSDFHTIKNDIDMVVQDYKSVILHLVDSISITSSIIGYLTKLALKEKIYLEVLVGDENLYKLLSELNLISALNIRMVKA